MSYIVKLLGMFVINVPFSLPRVSVITWLLLKKKLKAEVLTYNDDLHVRLANSEDIDWLHEKYNEIKASPGSHVLAQNLMFWGKLNFRSLYVGCEAGALKPAVICYFFGPDDKEKIANMQDVELYSHVDDRTFHIEGIFVLPEQRGRSLAYRMGCLLHKNAYKQEVVSVYRHVPAEWSKIANFKSTAKLGYLPCSWVHLVKIDLPWFRSLKNTFIRQPIAQRDFKKFPLNLF